MDLWIGDVKVATNVNVAASFIKRLRGMIGNQIAALWIPRCGSVHTYFMSKSIDILFLDRDMGIIAITKNVRPGRICWQKNAAHVLEVNAGLAEQWGLRVGQILAFNLN